MENNHRVLRPLRNNLFGRPPGPPRRPRFYIVAVGVRPGVYINDFRVECEAAIGDRNGVPKPQWRKFHYDPDAAEIEKFREFAREHQLPAELLEAIPECARRTYGIGQVNGLQAEQAAGNDQIQDVALRAFDNGGGDLRAFLEARYEQAMATVAHKVRDGPVGADNALMQQHYHLTVEGRLIVAYTHGAFFKAGPDELSCRAGIGVWFGENSPLNIYMKHIPEMRCSKNDAELFAALCALRIAKIKGLQLVTVKTSSKVVVEQINKTSGVSMFLRSKLLDTLTEIIPRNQIRRVVVSSKREKGSKEAKNLALRSLRPQREQ